LSTSNKEPDLPIFRDAEAHAERILDAAEEVFAERGFDAASLGDVADRVGIRPQAIYNHFSGKRELYAAVLERLLGPFLALLDEARRRRRGRDAARRRRARHRASTRATRTSRASSSTRR
jgi:AcrR family transcriptional regulator